MKNITITARHKDGLDDYKPLTFHGLSAQIHFISGDGTPNTPLVQKITITAEQNFEGVIRISMPLTGHDPRFYLPGFMYGTNRGDAPLLVDSKCPRLRMEDSFPASPWWMVRSDRLSHPCAFAYSENQIVGLSASPYTLLDDNEYKFWEPGIQGTFAQYNGFGCSLSQNEIWYTLGYENAPWLFIDSHKYVKRTPLNENCFILKQGTTVTFYINCFNFPAKDERSLHHALKWVYEKYHELPRHMCNVQETVMDIATAISCDAWLPDQHMYSCFVFDKEDGYEYRLLPSISWTNGLASAVPMLTAALRLNDETMRNQALDCIEHIVENSMNPQNNLPYTVEQDGIWSNKGWWYDKQNVPGHTGYLVGQFIYLLLKAYAWEERERDIIHENWLDFAKKVISVTEKSRNVDGEYPYILSEKTGAGLEYDSFSGAWCMAAATYYSYLTKDSTYLPMLLQSAQYYYATYITHQECYGGPLDIDKNIDSEGILAYIRAVRYLHELTEEDYLLDYLRDALYYEYTFKFCYNSPIKIPPLSTVGWSSCGGSITSVTNPHIHPMSSSIMNEMHYYLMLREDNYIHSRLKDTLLWSCQCHMKTDKEYGYGRKGWMSERFCHSEGLLTEHYPDGTPASTWFALMPWACGSILEGLTDNLW